MLLAEDEGHACLDGWIVVASFVFQFSRPIRPIEDEQRFHNFITMKQQIQQRRREIETVSMSQDMMTTIL